MRGKAPCRTVLPHAIGITPAYAGKRNENEKLQSVKQDHPRLCGEKQRVEIVTGSRAGSPPPMRGKEAVILCSGQHLRITPAYAGKSGRNQ